MELVKVGNQVAMSSLEIAKLTGKRHDHVMTDINKMFKELGINAPDFSGTYKTARGNKYKCFNLPKRETLILVSGYSIKMRAAIIDRWQVLEDALAAKKSARLEGKQVRRLTTDTIKAFISYAKEQGSENADRYYSNISVMTNKIVGIKAGDRDNLSIPMLRILSIIETTVELALRDGMVANLHYKEIYQLAKVRSEAIINTFHALRLE